jgi:hypothetical protein
MPKRGCVYTDSLEAAYPFLKGDQQVGKVLCPIYKSQFSTEHGGRSDVLQHIKKRKHTIPTETKSCIKKVTSYFTKETVTDECKHIAAEEGLCTPHNKTQPFLSIHGLYILSDKIVRGKIFMWSRKCESIAVNVLAPFAMQQFFEEF